MSSQSNRIDAVYWAAVVFAALFLVIAAGSLNGQSAGGETVEGTQRISADELIHFGDLVDVDVVGSSEWDWRGTLTPEGFLDGISFVDDGVFALCRDTTEVAEAVSAAYGRFLNRPQVRVTILDRSGRAPAVIFGAVKIRQRLRMNRPVSLAEALVLSGGLTDQASGEIQILRRSLTSCAEAIDSGKSAADSVDEAESTGRRILKLQVADLIAGKAEANPVVAYGDVITVLESKPVYVTGGVANPSRIRFSEGISLSRAVASAGGFSRNAEPENVTIFRRSGAETEVIKASMKGGKTPPENDPELQPYDIVEVGQKGGDPSRYPPVIDADSSGQERLEDLPVRIID